MTKSKLIHLALVTANEVTGSVVRDTMCGVVSNSSAVDETVVTCKKCLKLLGKKRDQLKKATNYEESRRTESC